MAMAKPILLLRSPEIMSHLEHTLHELKIVLDPVFNGVETTLLCPTASIACFLNQGGFRAHIASPTLRSDSELETSLDILAQEVVRLCNTCARKLLSPQVSQVLHRGLGQHSVAFQFG